MTVDELHQIYRESWGKDPSQILNKLNDAFAEHYSEEATAKAKKRRKPKPVSEPPAHPLEPSSGD
jgi:hypothetical protein